MSVSTAVGDLARCGIPIADIARRLSLPRDLVVQVVDHLQRTGASGSLPAGGACAAVACAGCFFAKGCTARA